MHSWPAARRPTRADSNCAEKLGPDYDFGGSSAILANRQRQGHPVGRGEGRCSDRARSRQGRQAPLADSIVGNSSAVGLRLVVWGGAADGAHVYYPLQQPAGGLKALDIQSRRGGVERGHQCGPPRAGWSGQCDGSLLVSLSKTPRLGLRPSLRPQCSEAFPIKASDHSDGVRSPPQGRLRPSLNTRASVPLRRPGIRTSTTTDSLPNGGKAPSSC